MRENLQNITPCSVSFLTQSPTLNSRFSLCVCFLQVSSATRTPERGNAEEHMAPMEKLKAAWTTGKEWAGVARSNPARTMKLLSAVSGALLIIGGISGVINIFDPLGIVISIYNM